MPGFLFASDAPVYRRLCGAIDAYLDAKDQAHVIDVVPMTLLDWLKIALLGNDFRDYLDRAASLVEQTGGQDSDWKTVIVGHSAGGWVARLLLGIDTVEYNGRRFPGLRQKVKRLITLGTPHYSKEMYPFGRVKERICSGDKHFDSSLAFTNEYFGDASSLAPTEIHSFLGIVDDNDKPTMMTQVSYAANAGAFDPGMRGDAITPLHPVAELRGTTVHLIANCGHFDYHEHIESFGQYLLFDES